MILSGAVAALGHAPLSWAVLTLIGFGVAAGVFVKCASPRPAAIAGWFFGIGYFAVALSWIVEPFLIFPVRDGWMAPFALVGIAGALSLFWAAGFAAAHGIGSGNASRCLALAVAVSVAGILRENILTGFPWALPA